MDITSFTLGILSVAFTFNFVGAVFNLVMVYKLKRELNEFNQMISDTTNWTSKKFVHQSVVRTIKEDQKVMIRNEKCQRLKRK